ncbi:MAG TPA: SDR family oxidoreductase [Ilumatobacter sp.]|nr:SDR family oxidoreductase [Ilumatobacter sp.]
MNSPPRSAHTTFDLSGVPAEVITALRLDRLPVERAVTSTADLLRLDGKVAVVTGGGGQGLGNAICHRLAEQGASIAIIDVVPEAGTQAADEIARVWGVPTFATAANVADWDAAHRAIDAVVEHFGTIDILVNNAGGSGSIGLSGDQVAPPGSFLGMQRGDIETTVGVNLMGVLYVTRAALAVMVTNSSGRIVNIASEGGKVGAATHAVYGSCKSAVIGLTRNLAHEFGPQGISVVAVCPALMLSERLVKSGRLDASPDGLFGWTLKKSTIGRLSLPDEVASTVAFLASDAGSYVHGTAVSVGGGFSD